MLFPKDDLQYLYYGVLRSAVICYLIKARLVGQKVCSPADCLYFRLVQFFFSVQDGFCASGQQDVIVQRWNETFSPSIQKLHRKVDTAAAAVADDVSIIAVEDGKASDARNGLHTQEIAKYIVHGIIPQSKQGAQYAGFPATMWLAEVPVNILLDAGTVRHLSEIAEQHRAEVEINVRLAEYLAEVFHHQINDCRFAGAVRPCKANGKACVGADIVPDMIILKSQIIYQ